MVAGDLFDVLKLDDKLHFAWHQWILVAENFDLVIFFLELSGVIRQDHDDLIFENTFESDDVLQELFKALVYVWPVFFNLGNRLEIELVGQPLQLLAGRQGGYHIGLLFCVMILWWLLQLGIDEGVGLRIHLPRTFPFRLWVFLLYGLIVVPLLSKFPFGQFVDLMNHDLIQDIFLQVYVFLVKELLQVNVGIDNVQIVIEYHDSDLQIIVLFDLGLRLRLNLETFLELIPKQCAVLCRIDQARFWLLRGSSVEPDPVQNS